MNSPSRYAVVALERGLVILQALAESNRPMHLTDVVAATGMPKTTTFRVLATLEGRGYVDRTPEGGYRPGLRSIQLAQAARAGNHLLHAAQATLKHLHHLSRDTVNLAAWQNGQIVYVEVLPSLRPLRFEEMLGTEAPLHATALGKAVLAQMADDIVVQLLKDRGLRKFTPHTITNIAAFRAELQRVRSRGYAIDQQEKDMGAVCLAAPVLDAQGVVGAISISAPAAHLDTHRTARLAPLLRDACAVLSRQLGWKRPQSTPSSSSRISR